MDRVDVLKISDNLGHLRVLYAETQDADEKSRLEQQYEEELAKLPPEERRPEEGLLGGDVFAATGEEA